MDSPPVGDHGSDRYDYVEVTGAPPHVNPEGAWWDALIAAPCPDCRANVFAEWRPQHGMSAADAGARRHWSIMIAHDETCPTAKAIGVPPA